MFFQNKFYKFSLLSEVGFHVTSFEKIGCEISSKETYVEIKNRFILNQIRLLVQFRITIFLIIMYNDHKKNSKHIA